MAKALKKRREDVVFDLLLKQSQVIKNLILYIKKQDRMSSFDKELEILKQVNHEIEENLFQVEDNS